MNEINASERLSTMRKAFLGSFFSQSMAKGKQQRYLSGLPIFVGHVFTSKKNILLYEKRDKGLVQILCDCYENSPALL